MELLYIGVFLCAVAFAIVCFLMAKVLLHVSGTLKSLGNTLGEVETKMQYITAELENTIKESGKTIDEFEHKLKVTDGLFDTLENVGSTVTNLNQVVDGQTRNLASDRALRNAEPVAHSLQWSEVGFRLFKKLKKGYRKGEEA